MRAWMLSLILLVCAARTALADGATAQWKLHGGSPHANVPFQLDLVVDGFDESPAPELPKVEIANSTVAPIGAQPNVSRSIQIINGRRSDSTRVVWVLSYRVEPKKAGPLHVPAVTVAQGKKSAQAEAGETEVDEVPTSADQKLALALPDRAVFVGESVPVTLTWTFRGKPQEDPVWSVPLMTSDAFTASGPPVTDPRRALTFPAGGKDLQLPYTMDQVDTPTGRANRVTVQFSIAPRKEGKVEVPAASVVVALPVGREDFFGNAPSKLFRAADVARTLEVKPLPVSDRPAAFAGAVGDQFSLDVSTSRSVVSLGEPVELAIRIKSNQRLDTLALGRLDAEGRLPKDKFTVPADVPTGALSDDGKTKTFKVTVTIAGAATEIPALAFAYFDPAKEQYQTIHSEPIALSLKSGGTVVGASDVVSAKPTSRGSAAPELDPSVQAQVGAELALSSPSAVGEKPLGGTPLWVLVALLYAIPLALFAARTWALRTAGQREEAAEVKTARRRVEGLLDRAGTAPAREVAGPLAAALRDFARAVGREPIDDGGLVARLETESFAPGAGSVPLSADLRSDAAGRLRRWTTEARATRSRKKAAAVAVLLVAGLGAARADAAPLDEGRTAYEEAMLITKDPSARKAAFARAAVALGEAARATPDRPELLADWGNAALGAGDVATATLAYRRALLLDQGTARARRNLAWLRSRQPPAFQPPAASGATDTLLFFHSWPRARKLVVGAIAFALGLLALVPWRARRRLLSGAHVLALLPLAVWLAMLASALLEDRHADDGVVMDDVVVRAADNAGAPAALSQPLSRGVEVTIVERRDAWTRVRLPNDASGWVPAGAVERVAP